MSTYQDVEDRALALAQLAQGPTIMHITRAEADCLPIGVRAFITPHGEVRLDVKPGALTPEDLVTRWEAEVNQARKDWAPYPLLGDPDLDVLRECAADLRESLAAHPGSHRFSIPFMDLPLCQDGTPTPNQLVRQWTEQAGAETSKSPECSWDPRRTSLFIRGETYRMCAAMLAASLGGCAK